jgi:aminoglycoside phosphotransferase family enzyme/predicted kinase
VFLVGDRAYKLKRAVRFSFIDFSTSARRREMCCAELRINRRTAPDIYLGVAAIERGPQGLQLSPLREAEALPQTALDWVVVMRRFDGQRLLSALATLPPDLPQRLAAAVTAFHAAAERTPDKGGAAALAEAVAMDVAQMQQRGDLLDRALTAELAQAMPAEAAAVGAIADARRDVGAVRRCHGDLHTGNIFLDAADNPVPFDAIEFNDKISCIDILYDLAFLLMDLDFRGLRAEANRLLNQYLWLSRDGDADTLAGLRLLPIYLARRGAIRAHVGAANLAHLHGQAAQHERDQAIAYQRYALQVLKPLPARLIAIGGLSGTGKTTMALALAPKIGATPGAVVLRTDVIRKRLAGVAQDQRMPPGWYTAENSAATYRRLAELARIALQAGRSVVADAVFAAAWERDAIAAVAREVGVRFAGLWLEAPGDTLKQRGTQRRGDASDATAQVVERQLGYDLQTVAWPRLSTAGSLAQILPQARRQLDV